MNREYKPAVALMVFFLTLQPSTTRAQAINVSGLDLGGCASFCNGDYLLSGTGTNGKNIFIRQFGTGTNGACTLSWPSGLSQWSITSPLLGECSSSPEDCGPNPPDTGWVAGLGGTPTVTGDVCQGVLPVELIQFEALSDGASVLLTWSTISETSNSGFSVEREVGFDAFAEIAFVEGHGTTVEPQEYSLVLNDVDPGLYRFRLKQIDFDGAFEYSSVVEAAVTVPDRFLIEPAYPNPFNPTTMLRFAVATDQHVDVTLVNSAGQSIRTLYNGTVAANEMQQLVVNAESLPSGTYFVHFEGSGLSATERILLAK